MVYLQKEKPLSGAVGLSNVDDLPAIEQRVRNLPAGQDVIDQVRQLFVDAWRHVSELNAVAFFQQGHGLRGFVCERYPEISQEVAYFADAEKAISTDALFKFSLHLSESHDMKVVRFIDHWVHDLIENAARDTIAR